MIGAREIAMLPKGAVIVNTARGPILDLDAVEAALRSGRLAARVLMSCPTSRPLKGISGLLCDYRPASLGWGRLIITPHSAFASPEAYEDIKRKSAQTMRATLIDKTPQKRPSRRMQNNDCHCRGSVGDRLKEYSRASPVAGNCITLQRENKAYVTA